MGFPHVQQRVERAQQVMGELRLSSGLIGIVVSVVWELAQEGQCHGCLFQSSWSQ